MSRRKAVVLMEHAKWWPSTHLVRKRIDDLAWAVRIDRVIDVIINFVVPALLLLWVGGMVLVLAHAAVDIFG